MAKSGRDGARTVVRGRGRDSARGGDIADPSESLPAPCTRPLGEPVAAEGSEGRCNHRPLRGRRRAGVAEPARSRAVPRAVAGAAGEVRAGTAPGEDAPDRIRALRRRAPGEAWSRKTGDLQLFRFHPHVWDEPEGGLLRGAAQDHRQAYGSQAERNQGAAAGAHARVHRGYPEVAAVCGEGVLPISRQPGQRAANESVSERRAAIMATPASAAESTEPLDLEALSGAAGCPNSFRPHGTSLSSCALRRQTSKVGTVCASSASTGLCGGQRATAVPTATRVMPAEERALTSGGLVKEGRSGDGR